MTPLRGACLCGDVRYEIRAGLEAITLCHCSMCRKAQGSAFAAVAPVRTADFHLLSGESSLAAFESSPGKERLFCRRCGSPIYSRRRAEPDTLRVRIGTLETPVGRRPDAHIFVADRADWDDRLDQVPAYPGFEPARDRPS
jgi:hypothetical protein